jgi:hypothetical protein
MQKVRRPYCLGSAESPAADFLLVWLKSSRSDPCRCVASLSCRPQVRDGLPERCFYLRTLSRTVLAGCTSPTSQNSRGNKKSKRPLEFWEFLLGLFQTHPLGTSWAWPLRRYTEGGGEHQNDVTGRAEKGEGGVRRADCLWLSARGAPYQTGGRGVSLGKRSHLPLSLLLSALLPFLSFNVSFAYFRLAVRLSLHKKKDR